ncbi:hypothetical protein EW146_g9952 [Bondarzewia mesenterica]|uniref:DUF6589 domain-containing protein n=1 Tax=Bondarzewia mesenterica TaxID=1095465 RepID=A0A4S4L1R1_9AGAM|nr:hypothetical protein EW146_g9952 [Bondarzewia mesenterica]
MIPTSDPAFERLKQFFLAGMQTETGPTTHASNLPADPPRSLVFTSTPPTNSLVLPTPPPTITSSPFITPKTPTRSRFVASQTINVRCRRIPFSPTRTPLNQKGTPQKQKKTRRSPRTIEEKLSAVLNLLKDDVRWTLGEFLYYVFRVEAEDGKVHRSRRHAGMVSRFLQGKTDHTVSDILDAWLRTPDGRPRSDEEKARMFSLKTSYLDIDLARPAITSFAAQVVQDQMVRERRNAVQPSSGLHVSRSKRALAAGKGWDDISIDMLNSVRQILKTHQPLTWRLLVNLATPKQRGKVIPMRAVRDHRPAEQVVTNVLSALNFAHNKFANKLAMAQGMLYFATGAQETIYRISSRIGMSVSYTTTYRTLRSLGHESSAKLLEWGADPGRGYILRLDNVQTFLKRRMPGIGRTDQVMMGTAAIVVEAEDYNAVLMDLDDKRRRIEENRRSQLTVDSLHDMIDIQHIHSMLGLQWLLTLVEYVPELAKYKSEVIKLFRTDSRKLTVLSTRRSHVQPLATNDKNEALIVELKDALLDFFQQMHQTQDAFQRRLIFTGGDGLTYEKMVLLKLLHQFHNTEFERFDFMEPFLEQFHTNWTDLSRIFETHWGEERNKDPSTLGHSAGKIGFKTPSDLKKVDYYSARHLAYLVLAARMIDCWRCNLFQIPTLETLKAAACTLHFTYTSFSAYHRSMAPHDPVDPHSVPLGTSWTQPIWMTEVEGAISEANNGKKRKYTRVAKGGDRESDDATPADASSTDKKKKVQNFMDLPFFGDRPLAQSGHFMMDTALSREVTMATDTGAIGRVWEVFKLWIFTFSGSSHSKYPGYLLEMVANLELESHPDLRDWFMQNWLVNLKGEAGHWMEGDKMVEHNNNELQKLLSRKDVEWGGPFMREVVSPNIFRLSESKTAFVQAIGLQQKSTQHPPLHTQPEFVTLTEIYKKEELHLFHPGRDYGRKGRDVADYERGADRLREGKLARWVHNTTSMRNLARDARGKESEVAEQVLIAHAERLAREAEDAELREQELGEIPSEVTDFGVYSHSDTDSGSECELPLTISKQIIADEDITETGDIEDERGEDSAGEWEGPEAEEYWQESEPEPQSELEFDDEMN